MHLKLLCQQVTLAALLLAGSASALEPPASELQAPPPAPPAEPFSAARLAPWPGPPASLALTDPLLDAFGLDRYQTPAVERLADPYAAGAYGPSRWSWLPSLPPLTVDYPLAALSPLLAGDDDFEPSLALSVYQPTRPAPCKRRPVVAVRFGGESESFLVAGCDNAVRHEGLERLSVLARPPGVERPALPLPDEPSSPVAGEWVDHIKLVPPRLAAFIQKLSDAFPHRPIYIISGYRPKASHGFHAQGHAIDLFVMNVPNERVYRFCRKMNDMGCGYYPNNKFVHVDVRPPGTGQAYWIDTSAPGEPSNYVDSWPGVEKGGAAIWMSGKGGGG